MNFADLTAKKIPYGSVLGISYSGMHDTSIALVAPEGEPIFAVSLERISRIKQDGRLPRDLLQSLPWERISKAAISVSKTLDTSGQYPSKLLPIAFDSPPSYNLAHGSDFYKITDLIPCETIFVPHHMSHASSAFWGSGFNEAICLIYDGGMSNENYFGGLYSASLREGIFPLDQFSALHYANVTRVYTAVTAILGFTPLKHEGKITGLAAYGKPTQRCRDILMGWLHQPSELDGLLHWANMYEENKIPELVVNDKNADYLRLLTSAYSREELASTVQEIAESHVIDILQKAFELGWKKKNICLAGGLFANVKINQRVAELGFENVFVAPPMADDGTALGAAWHILSSEPGFAPTPLRTMYLGPDNKPDEAQHLLNTLKIKYRTTKNPAKELASLLAGGEIVAVFQGACEFGPRALGNRSILAQATKSDINLKLNQRLNRTEFMPFAPVVRLDDADLCFEKVSNVQRACAFMTVTVNCTEKMKAECPAVVHIDGTARPQLVTRKSNRLVYDILSLYYKITTRLALVNTSFNVHEEPIVCSAEDALRGFFESGLDHMYLEGAGIIKRSDNLDIEIQYVREKLNNLSVKNKALMSANRKINNQTNSAYTLFACGQSTEAYLAEGFHSPESWGVWSSGRYARVILPVELAGAAEVELHVSMVVKVFDGILASAPVLQVVMDGTEVGVVLFRKTAAEVQEISFYGRVKKPVCELEFNLTFTNSPFITSLSGDQRELGFGLCSLGMAISSVKENDAGTSDTGHEVKFWGV